MLVVNRNPVECARGGSNAAMVLTRCRKRVDMR